MACKGSWKDSAKNIRYNGDTVECELKAKNGNWIKNKLRFSPNYEYSNNDGNFECYNFKGTWKNSARNITYNGDTV